MNFLTEKLLRQEPLTVREFSSLLREWDPREDEALFALSRRVRERIFGKKVYIRGLIEISSYCRNDCYYCGIRRSNRRAERYRLTEEEILACAEEGQRLGFRTFVLQGGEDVFYTAERTAALVRELKRRCPGCAVTLSLGERPEADYRLWREAGADRYLLRHETADALHYRRLHPASQSPEYRKQCLYALKRLGYQVGTGMMVGAPFQTLENLAEDLYFIQELQPQMIGIGPFLSHKDTPFAGYENGGPAWTLRLLAFLRFMRPAALLPATTALGTLCDGGRELGILAGANVVMPNLSPESVRKKYMLYDGKLGTGAESSRGLEELKERMRRIGYEIVTERGDYPFDV